MNYSRIALVLLALLPATLQAAQSPSGRVASGTIRFTGEITAPACTIKHQNEGIISNCYGVNSAHSNALVTTSLKNMPPELVSSVTTEMINNNENLKNVTISYK
ncbi:hypothetical protein FCL49_01585 [Serratia proteamaculans]|uniref:hypothetical protein n=1 Tax=Serratia TaxID=613 RepID=UPI001576EED6|nr:MULTISPECIES: hypothetical protein [Serratia]NTX78973.1 hypothetical protein [Serratia proteamaculans]NTZ26786.1 hypothetical protein [Serratia proteamaculans]CAI0829222.1 Uncharacterised protein [Serratia quinivorans]